METAIHSIQLVWFGQCWPKHAFQADGSFHNTVFKKFIDQYDIQIRQVLPCGHCKNPIKPRHGTIRSIFQNIPNRMLRMPFMLLAL